jgi:hypothetical protein
MIGIPAEVDGFERKKSFAEMDGTGRKGFGRYGWGRSNPSLYELA